MSTLQSSKVRWHCRSLTTELNILHSCSLPCFKQHKKACISGPSQAVFPSEFDSIAVSDEPAPQPFSLDDAELDSLFTKYPTLKAQLQHIYASTQTSDRGLSTVDANSSKPRKAGPGFQTGLHALQDALDRHDAGSDGIIAFITLLNQKAAR